MYKIGSASFTEVGPVNDFTGLSKSKVLIFLKKLHFLKRIEEFGLSSFYSILSQSEVSLRGFFTTVSWQSFRSVSCKVIENIESNLAQLKGNPAVYSSVQGC